jgi:hypothetical protein
LLTLESTRHRRARLVNILGPGGSDDFHWSLCYSHYVYPALLAAQHFRIAEALSPRWQPIDSVARTCGLQADALISLLPTLELFGLGEVSSRNTIRAARVASRTIDARWEPMFQRHRQFDPHYGRLLSLFMHATPKSGDAFWAKLLRNTDERRHFFESVDAHTSSTAITLANQVRSRRVRSWVDVGGGYGTNTFAALEREPCFGATLIDQTEVTQDVLANEHAIGRYGHRLKVVAQDVRRSGWPRGAQVYLLSHLLQDFGSDDRMKILAQARRVVDADSRLWIHGNFFRPRRPMPVHAAFSFYLYCHLGGTLQSTARQAWECAAAGFRLTDVVPTSGIHALLIFKKMESSR